MITVEDSPRRTATSPPSTTSASPASPAGSPASSARTVPARPPRMRIMVGLTPPTRGRVTIGGHLYHDIPNPGRHVGVLLDASAQHAGRTGREILTLGARTMGLPDVARRRDARRWSRSTDDEAKRRVRNYSLGMKQRLGIAHALLGDPSVLILDEPANGLDPAGIRWMRGLLKGYADRGGTVLLSSHLLHEVELIADEMILIGRGKIVAQGDKKTLLASAAGTPRLVTSLDNDRARRRPCSGAGFAVTRRRATALPRRAPTPVEVGRVAADAADRPHRPALRRGRASRTCSSSSPPTPSATATPPKDRRHAAPPPRAPPSPDDPGRLQRPPQVPFSRLVSVELRKMRRHPRRALAARRDRRRSPRWSWSIFVLVARRQDRRCPSATSSASPPTSPGLPAAGARDPAGHQRVEPAHRPW